MEALHNSLLLAFYLGHPGNNVGNASNEVWAKLPHKVVVRAKVLPSSCQLIQAGCSLQKINFWVLGATNLEIDVAEPCG